MFAVYGHGIRHEWISFNPISKVRCSATGLRVSELFALRWSDVDFENLELNVTRSIWHQVVGNCKTEASAKPVPMDSYMAEDLLRWRRQSDYASDNDYVFASETMKGKQPYKQPYCPDNLMKRHIGPVVAKANGINKNIGWHTFRHSFGTLLKANREDVKTVQELLRHANSRITLDVYTQAVSSNKRAAQSKVVEMMVPNLGELKDEKLSQNGR
ncbi:MAG TPA: site-specific integrase [Terracidiphilus sp.]|nr:site-specific integrase [Terracidiphilus sp.]